jgi:hypothetical protein
MHSMTPRARLLAALRWEEPDQVPLTCYAPLLPSGYAERRLRNAGLGLVVRLPVHTVEYRTVRFSTCEYWENGERVVRKTIHTPIGRLSQTLRPDPAYGTSHWVSEHFIKGPADYQVMEYVQRDAIYHDNFDAIRENQRRLGDDGIVMVRLMKIPLTEILYQMTGLERFAADYRFQREPFDSLHNTMLERCEELYDLAAAAPVEIIQMSDNITADVVGKERFLAYCAPVYARLAQRLSGSGKLIAVHLDGRLRALRDAIARANFEVVEAFTPPPMGDFSLREARKTWPDKAIWLNYTSSLHIEAPSVIAAHTRQLLDEAGSKRGIAISVTEDAPAVALERSLLTIQSVLADYA